MGARSATVDGILAFQTIEAGSAADRILGEIPEEKGPAARDLVRRAAGILTQEAERVGHPDFTPDEWRRIRNAIADQFLNGPQE